MKSVRMLAMLAVCLGVSTLAVAGPIVLDGNVDSNDTYMQTFTDPDEPDISDGLDIKSLRFDLSGGWFSIGLETHGSFDPDGSLTSFLGETDFVMLAIESSSSSRLEVTTNNTGVKSVVLNDVTLLSPSDYEAVIGQGLEIRIKDSIFGWTSFDFMAQLDDTGFDNDDQITGTVTNIPEPATMAMLGLGGIGVLIRRRRRA